LEDSYTATFRIANSFLYILEITGCFLGIAGYRLPTKSGFVAENQEFRVDDDGQKKCLSLLIKVMWLGIRFLNRSRGIADRLSATGSDATAFDGDSVKAGGES